MILNYAKWKKVYEQATVGNDAITFVIAAGANSKPMADETLAKNQKYPAADNLPNSTTIYELILADALAGNFAKAAAVGQAANTEKDQIIFEDNSIKNKGKLVIEWNPVNATKQIRVSGNGALVLARAFNAVKQDSSLLSSSKGVIVLELGANELYSNLWAIDQMGLSVSRLMSSVRGIIDQVAVQTSNSTLKSELAKKWGDSVEWIESKYCPDIIEIQADGNTVRNRPDLEKNTSLSAHYGKYSYDDFTKNKKALNILAPIVKTNVIDAGLDALSNYVDLYFKGKLVGLAPNYLARFTDSVKSNIAEAKAKATPEMIKYRLETAITAVPSEKLSGTPTQTTIKSTTYKEGESN